MPRTESSHGSYIAAAAVGGLCGGLAAVFATRKLPKLLPEMKTQMHEICNEKCGCGPEGGETPSEPDEPSSS